MNPCCCLLIRRRSNRYRSKVSLIMRSITLQHVAVKDIGRKLFGSEVGRFLWTGVTIAYFQVSGKQPSTNEILKIWHNGLARLLAQFLRKTFGMQSYPLEVLGFSFSNTLLTVCGVKVIVLRPSSTARLLTSGQSPLSTVNTLPKNLLKIPAFILGSVVIVSSSIFSPTEAIFDFSLLLIKLKKLPRLFLRTSGCMEFIYSVFALNSSSLIQYFILRCMRQLPAFPQNGFLLSQWPCVVSITDTLTFSVGAASCGKQG